MLGDIKQVIYHLQGNGAAFLPSREGLEGTAASGGKLYGMPKILGDNPLQVPPLPNTASKSLRIFQWLELTILCVTVKLLRLPKEFAAYLL